MQLTMAAETCDTIHQKQRQIRNSSDGSRLYERMTKKRLPRDSYSCGGRKHDETKTAGSDATRPRSDKPPWSTDWVDARDLHQGSRIPPCLACQQPELFRQIGDITLHIRGDVITMAPEGGRRMCTIGQLRQGKTASSRLRPRVSHSIWHPLVRVVRSTQPQYYDDYECLTCQCYLGTRPSRLIRLVNRFIPTSPHAVSPRHDSHAVNGIHYSYKVG
ncbi:hypothetical protein HDV62DRAFT_191916 [Trichoderma sp. SZMC 28011]